MALKERVARDFNNALKERDDRRLSVLRLLRTEMKKREVSGQKKELSDEEVTEILSSFVKQRKESIRLFHEGQRPDLVEKEEAELKILLSYLPQPLSQAELEALIDQVIQETEANGPKDHGRVMKSIMAKIAGRAEGKVASEVVKEKLSRMAS